MNLSETARLLGAMAAFDRRTVGDADVIAWQAVMADASFDDCLEAVKRHYAEDTEWMMPAHVRRIVRDIHGERRSLAGNPWAPGQHGVPKDEAMPEMPGPFPVMGELKPEIRALLDSVRAMLPEGSREDLMPRREYWDREHRTFLRTQNAEPNPLYKPSYYDTQATAGTHDE